MTKSRKIGKAKESANGPDKSLFQRRPTLGPHYAVQREANANGTGSGTNAYSMVHDVVSSPGHPLDSSTRSAMEPRFSQDLSRVRVHTDHAAARSARAVSANAYTVGSHVVFDSGQYAPGTPGGRRLMAHELTHVAQQASGPVAGVPVAPSLSISQPSDPHERAARAYAGVFPETAAFPTSRHFASPAHTADLSHLYLQRDTAGDVGAVAGVAGGIIALGALGVAIAQLVISTHPPASASPTGGMAITHAQLGPVMAAQQPAAPAVPQGAAPTPAPAGGAATGGSPGPTPAQPSPALLRRDILTMTASDTSNATIALMLRTDGHNILEAYTQEQDVQGYPGGTHENANISFRTVQITSADPTIAEAVLIFDGINANGDSVQRFTGRIRVRGNGEVVCESIRKTAGPGDVGGAGTIPATSTLQVPRPAAGGGLSPSLGAPSDDGDPSRLLPFNRPMAGG